ncbi:MAG: (2Fe-2S)-binding protein [Polyangiales bacterium]
MTISLHVNGKDRIVDASPTARLLDVLRVSLALTGTKEGCGEGECGSCTVLLDGLPVNACLVLAGQAEGHEVTTIEGLAGDHLGPIQRCFVEHGGAQCGICTPGMIIAAEALLRGNTRPTDGQIRDAIAGNICRCTGYQRIVDSIRNAAAIVDEQAGAKPGGEP